MKERCQNENHLHYKEYGGRGISITDKWKDSFQDFWKDMGPTYFDGASLDRIDNEKGYSRDNCRWATPREQMHNRRDNIVLSRGGVKKPIWEWVQELGLNRKTIMTRLKKGERDDEALRKVKK